MLVDQRFAGVKPQERPIFADQLRAGPADVAAGHGALRRVVPGAKWVEPGMQLQPAPVCLGDGKRQRIVIGLGRAPHRAGEVFAPRLQLRGIERVAAGPHLEDDGVEPQCHGLVEQGNQFVLLLRRGQAGLGRPVNVANGGDPGSAKFPLNGRRNLLRGDVAGGGGLRGGNDERSK